ncbi:MAG: cell division protein FtsQ/DivIB [Syntrophobacteraceae bacterium]
MRKKKNRYRTDKKKPLRVLAHWIMFGGTLGIVVCVVLALSAALAHSYHALLKAPWLRVEEIQITGIKHMQRSDILNALEVPRNTGVLNLKLSDLAKRLETLPWLRTSVIRLDLPGRIVVEATEREPLAVVCADDFLLLDSEGKLFTRTTIEQNRGFLLVTGFSGSGLKEGDLFPSEPFEVLKRLLGSLRNAQNWLPLQQISECRWIKDEGFVLYTAQRAIPIELGLDDFDVKLQRLQRVFGVLAERQWLDLVTRIDLDYSNHVYVGGNFPTPKGI